MRVRCPSSSVVPDDRPARRGPGHSPRAGALPRGPGHSPAGRGTPPLADTERPPAFSRRGSW
jgi:hypothetical protein